MKFYHIIGMPPLEKGQLTDKHALEPGNAMRARVAQRQQDRFEEIVRSRALRPAPVDENLLTDFGRMEYIERLVGDHAYVFLHGSSDHFRVLQQEINYGFAFDAEPLIQTGEAVLRSHDFLVEYEDLLEDAIMTFEPGKHTDEWTDEEKAALFSALANPTEDYHGPDDAYYTLWDAVKTQDASVPYMAEATALYREKVKAFQQKNQWTGEEALERLHSASEEDRASFELLVPRKIPLTKAVAWIVAGEEVLPRKRGGQRGSRNASKEEKNLPEPLRFYSTYSREKTAAMIEYYRSSQGLRALDDREMRHYFDDPANVAELRRFYESLVDDIINQKIHAIDKTVTR